MEKFLHLFLTFLLAWLPVSFIRAAESVDLQLKSVRLEATNWMNGETMGCYCSIYNAGTTSVSSVKLSFSIDDEFSTTVEKALSLSSNKSQSLYIELPISNLTVGTNKEFVASIVEVNGAPDDDISNNTAQSTINVAETLFPRRVVVEEGTGLWCQWCVRGIVGMQALTSNHPDDVIGIAVHNNDVLTVKEYTERQSQSNFPFAIIDRVILDQTVSAETLETCYEYETQNRALASIDLAADWNADSTAIDVTLSTTFGYTSSDSYNLAFVVVEDSVQGCKQKNAYAGGASGEMGGFEQMDAYVEVPMNHVARSIWPSYEGETYFTETQNGTSQTLTFSVPLPTTLQSTEHLSLVAILLDKSTGSIVNAASVPLHAGQAITPEEPSDDPSDDEGGKTVIDDGKGDANGYQYVDLGLSVNWALANMLSEADNFAEASSPEAYGGYFGWADATGLLTSTNAEDYIPASMPEEISGSQYDIAHTKWGGSWRLPSHDDWLELIDNCDTQATDVNGIHGLLFTSKINGATLFMPMNGSRYGEEIYDQSYYGAYWTGTRYAGDLGDGQTYIYAIDFDDYGTSESAVDLAYTGMGIRPVFTKASTSIHSDLIAGEKVVRTEYYNLQGMRVSPNTKGIIIKRLTYTNGHSTSVKILH